MSEADGITGTTGVSPLIGNITAYEFAVTASGSSGTGGTSPVELAITSAPGGHFHGAGTRLVHGDDGGAGRPHHADRDRRAAAGCHVHGQS